jgi:hypothetical protein
LEQTDTKRYLIILSNFLLSPAHSSSPSRTLFSVVGKPLQFFWYGNPVFFVVSLDGIVLPAAENGETNEYERRAERNELEKGPLLYSFP